MKTKNKLLIIFLIAILILINPCYASSLDDAKEMINNYYLYSQEKDVEKYSSLFDQQYLKILYGNDYKELFEEIFTYYDLKEYKISFQYYTESEDSLSLFYNLQAKTIIQDEKVNMDNDLVVLFSKNKEGLKIKYIMLQETFIEQMNREVIYESAIKSFVEESSDLEKEAEAKNIDLIDYKTLFEEKINSHNGTTNTIKIILMIFGIIIVLVILSIVFKEKVKNKRLKEYIGKTEKLIKNTGKWLKQKSKDIIIKIKKIIK